MDNLKELNDAMHQAAAQECANQAQAGLAGYGEIRGGERSHPDFALEAAATVARHLDAFYPGGPFVQCSRLLTRPEKIAALRAAIAVYENLGW